MGKSRIGSTTPLFSERRRRKVTALWNSGRSQTTKKKKTTNEDFIIENETVGKVQEKQLDGCISDDKQKALISSFWTRRRLLTASFLSTSLTAYPNRASSATSIDTTRNPNMQSKGNSEGDAIILLNKKDSPYSIYDTLKYQRQLGKGSYKTVYAVYTTTPITNDLTKTQNNDNYYAMAVERLRSKTETRDELRGIRLVQQIQAFLEQQQQHNPSFSSSSSSLLRSFDAVSTDDAKYFESIEEWWIQSTKLSDYQENKLIFPPPNNSTATLIRTKKRPTSFIGKNWYLISIKPLYAMDLKSFMNKSPILYPIVLTSPSTNENQIMLGSRKDSSNDVGTSSVGTITMRNNEPHAGRQTFVVGGINLSEEINAIRLVYEMCHAGRILHDDLGIVHRDIKPKNIMLSRKQNNGGGTKSDDDQKTMNDNGPNIVIIDFGFADFASRITSSSTQERSNSNAIGNSRLCITEVGKVKGEVKYVIPQDVALYRGCIEGDLYAMGRTIYEVFFGSAVAKAEQQPKGTTTAKNDDDDDDDSSASSSSISSTSSSISDRSKSSSSSSSSSSSGRHSITVESSTKEYEAFRKVIFASNAASHSRFLRMSSQVRDDIMQVVRGLCGGSSSDHYNSEALSFREAEYLMKECFIRSSEGKSV